MTGLNILWEKTATQANLLIIPIFWSTYKRRWMLLNVASRPLSAETL